MTYSKKGSHSSEYPDIFRRYVEEAKPDTMSFPRLATRRFHGREVSLWQGYVHVDDVEGYVENLRLRFYLNQWRSKQQPPQKIPTTDEVYQIMVEADKDERRESDRPFHIERMADSIIRNSVREPIILCYWGDSKTELWDGNRRFYGTKHIMTVDQEECLEARERVQWLPAYVFMPTGNVKEDNRVKHDILVECNFVESEQISWPAYVKAEQVYNEFQKRTKEDPGDPVLSRLTKGELAKEYGLKHWRTADRWIKMYDLALQFKEFHEEDRGRDSTIVDLLIQERFEYFDELSKPGVFGALRSDPDARDEAFEWMWDGKFKAWADVRSIPKILADPIAHKQANEPDEDAVKRAIATVIANDPVRIKDKTAANEKIKQFATWLDSFKREEYKMLNGDALDDLQLIVKDVVKITDALLSEEDLEREPASVASE